MTGIMLNTVDQELKTTANSLANLCYNLMGYLPSPFVYGYISDIGGDGNNYKAAMIFLMFMPLSTVFFLLAATWSLTRKPKNEQITK